MTTNRRTFLLTTAATTAATMIGQTARADEPAATTPKPAALRLSSQLRPIPGRRLGDKLEAMKQWGFDGVELPGDVPGKEKEYGDAIRDAGLVPSACCWGSCNGDLVGETEDRRRQGRDRLKQVLDAAGRLKTPGVIVVPAFHGQTTLGNQEIRKILVDTLPELGQYAAERGTRIILEPLNRGECFFLRQVADAAAICRDVNSPGVGLMGDFYHMAIEETSDLGAFISGGPYVHHVHLASRTRVLPGQDDRSFIEGFRGLKYIGFADLCSFECRVEGDGRVEIPKSMAFLRQQWDAAVGGRP
jgi:sugar phosphate isomerase/epimerase